MRIFIKIGRRYENNTQVESIIGIPYGHGTLCTHYILNFKKEYESRFIKIHGHTKWETIVQFNNILR